MKATREAANTIASEAIAEAATRAMVAEYERLQSLGVGLSDEQCVSLSREAVRRRLFAFIGAGIGPLAEGDDVDSRFATYGLHCGEVQKRG